MMMRRSLLLPLLLFLLLALLPAAALACFGAQLRVGVPTGGGAGVYASYATGYYIEEKTGVAPRFVVVEDGEGALLGEKIDLWLNSGEGDLSEGIVPREGGAIEGVGEITFWLNDDVLDDLRFTTVERALARMGAFFASKHFIENAAAENPKKAARKAVLDSD